jgi:hypothetical protein
LLLVDIDETVSVSDDEPDFVADSSKQLLQPALSPSISALSAATSDKPNDQVTRAAEALRRANEASDFYFASDSGDYGDVVDRDEELDRVDVSGIAH